MANSIDDYYDVYDVAQKFNTSPSRIYSQARYGHIPAAKCIYGRRLWVQHEIDSFIAKGGSLYDTNIQSIENDEVAVKYIKTLRRERKKLGLSIADLADIMGLGSGTIKNYERGYMPTQRNYDRLAKELGWPPYVPNRKNNSQAAFAVDNTPQKAEPQTTQIQLPLTQATQTQSAQPPLTIPEPLAESIRYLARIKGVKCNTFLASLLETSLKPYQNALNVLKGFKLD